MRCTQNTADSHRNRWPCLPRHGAQEVSGAAAVGWKEEAAAKLVANDRLDFNSSLNSLSSVSIHVLHPVLFASQGGACMRIHQTSKHCIISITGLAIEDTPMIVHVRGHLDSVKRLMTGDVYIGKGSKQRGMWQTEWRNPHKVAIFDRDEAIRKFAFSLPNKTQNTAG